MAKEIGNEDSAGYQALIDACLYILRLSNLPAGYQDLTADSAEFGGDDFVSQRNSWAPIVLAIRAELESGVLNSKRLEVERALDRTDKLIDDWGDATPMAARLLAEVNKYAVTGKNRLCIILPNHKYILLANRFFQRKLGSKWAEVEEKLAWHTLASVGKTLSKNHENERIIFVGVNRNVLRLLIAHPNIPHGTMVMISYKQAESTLTTLNGMKDIVAFKPYRGRLGLLAQELDRRLKEVPNPLEVGRLGRMSMTFNLEDGERSDTDNEKSSYKFVLEDGELAYANGWIYRYDPDEVPFFRRVSANSICVGDLIFKISGELRSKVESALQINTSGESSVVHPERALLKLYHDDVKSRCALLFKSTKRSVLAREIHAKMVSIDSAAEDCRPGRVFYWLDLQDGDNRPHAPKDKKFFIIFCKALEISDENAANDWNFIRNARSLNQSLGRELSARYAEILFQPESAMIYRKMSETVIKQLQQDALRCIHRVERIVPPETGVNRMESSHVCT